MNKNLLYGFLYCLFAIFMCTTLVACDDGDGSEFYDPKKDSEDFEKNKDKYYQDIYDSIFGDKDNDSSDENDNEEEEEEEEESRNCPSCNDGICTYCNGKGYTAIIGGNEVECNRCDGSGDCSRCDGTGEI